MNRAKSRKLQEEFRSSWFMPLRLAIFLLIFGAVVLSDFSAATLFRPFLFYSIATLLYLLLFQLRKKSIGSRLLSAVIFMQIAFELVVEGAIAGAAPELTSHYSILFLLTIVSASLIYRLLGTLLVAAFASIAYAITTSLSKIAEGSLIIDWQRWKFSFSVSDDVFYAMFLHLSTFFLVAFISGFLAEKLKVQERELSSASMRLARAQLDTNDILLNLHSGLLTIDNRGTILYFNHAAESILGFNEREVKSRSFLEVFNQKMPEFTERVLSVLKSSKPSIRTEVEIINKDGIRIPLGLSTSILGDERVGIRGVIAIFQDLTTAKKMESALLKADRLAAVGELSARIAHEIRNPLASISGSVQVLKSELAVGDENQRLMELIIKESDRLSRILSDFLSYARNTPAVSSKIELVSLIEETIELLKNNERLPQKVKLQFKTDHATLYVVGDDDQLRQILINLITNAAEAVDSTDGEIEIAVADPRDKEQYPPSEWIELQIVDNGIGFAPEDKKRIFEPFFSRKKGGTGLGLAIVKRSVDSIGARIQVDSIPGYGTTFYIFLKRYLAPVSEGHPRQLVQR